MLTQFLNRWKNGKRLYVTFMGCPTPAAVVELNGNIFAANHVLEKFLGYTSLELEGKHFRTLTDPRDVTADEDQFDRLVDGIIDSYTLSKRWVTKFDKVVKGELTVVPVYAPDGLTVECLLAYVIPEVHVEGVPSKVEYTAFGIPSAWWKGTSEFIQKVDVWKLLIVVTGLSVLAYILKDILPTLWGG